MNKTIMQKLLVIDTIIFFALAGCAHAKATTPMETCESSPSLQSEKSAELLKIVKEDQADRLGPIKSIDWSKVMPMDSARRVKVAAIFAEGYMLLNFLNPQQRKKNENLLV